VSSFSVSSSAGRGSFSSQSPGRTKRCPPYQSGREESGHSSARAACARRTRKLHMQSESFVIRSSSLVPSSRGNGTKSGSSSGSGAMNFRTLGKQRQGICGACRSCCAGSSCVMPERSSANSCNDMRSMSLRGTVPTAELWISTKCSLRTSAAWMPSIQRRCVSAKRFLAKALVIHFGSMRIRSTGKGFSLLQSAAKSAGSTDSTFS